MTDTAPLSARSYLPQDRGDCLAVFDSNLPKFFAPEERADFDLFLGELTEGNDYLLLLLGQEVVGCGGLTREAGEDSALLVWGMVRRDLHRRGLGRALLQARLDQARRMSGVRQVRLATSQHSAPFYAGFGFQVTRSEANGFGEGIDRIDMVLTL